MLEDRIPFGNYYSQKVIGSRVSRAGTWKHPFINGWLSDRMIFTKSEKLIPIDIQVHRNWGSVFPGTPKNHHRSNTRETSQFRYGSLISISGNLEPPPPCSRRRSNQPGWWFQIFFIFTLTWGNDPIWPICFKGVETTNQQQWCRFLEGCMMIKGPARSIDVVCIKKGPIFDGGGIEPMERWMMICRFWTMFGIYINIYIYTYNICTLGS